jgi:hypothetical protein
MKTQQERLNDIQERNQKVLQSSIQINTKIEAAIETDKKLSANLIEKYQTSNIDELEVKIKSIEDENERILTEAENALILEEKEIQEKEKIIKQLQQGL